MKLNKKIIIGVLVLALFGFSFWQLRGKNQENSTSVAQIQSAKLTVEINGGGQDFDVSEFVGKTALEATTSKVSTVTTGEGENAFITTLGGRMAETKKREFWEFLVNGTQAEVGAGSYIIQNNDQIVWKISTY